MLCFGHTHFEIYHLKVQPVNVQEVIITVNGL